MKQSTKLKIKDTAESIFFEQIQPNLKHSVIYGKDKDCIINGIRLGLKLAVNQGRKW